MEGMAATANPGDLIVIEAHHVGEPHRTGEILEILGEPGHAHYRIRREDGSETILHPSNDAKVEHVTGKRAAKVR